VAVLLTAWHYARRLRREAKPDKITIAKAELPHGGKRYGEYLKRLEELKARKRIPERIYVRLKEEYERRIREQGSR
jgi:hypothetical protein